MATTATVIANSRTPESVVLYLASDDQVEPVPATLSRAALEALLLEGPLKALIHRTADLRVLNQTGADVRMDDFVRFTNLLGGLSTALQPPTEVCVLNFLADALEFSLSGAGEPPIAAQLLVELRFVHSSDR